LFKLNALVNDSAFAFGISMARKCDPNLVMQHPHQHVGEDEEVGKFSILWIIHYEGVSAMNNPWCQNHPLSSSPS